MVDPVELTRALVRCPTVTPDAGPALDLLERTLQPLGFECRRQTFEEPGEAAVENLAAKLGGGRPHLAFCGHLDVVPPGDPARWSVDPFGGEIRDGRLYGRGAADMKSGVAAFVAAASRLAPEILAKGCALTLLLTGDEEGVAVNGTRKLLDWVTAAGNRFDACLVGEPTCPERLGEMAKVGRRGSLTGELRVLGRQGHTAYPQRADNAAHRAVAMLGALLAEPIDEGSSWFQPSSLQLTSIDIGNVASNVVPGMARVRFNIRYNDLQTVGSLERWLCQRLDREGARYELELRSSGDAFLTEPGPLSDLLAASVEAVTGLRPELSTSGGTSDARFVRRFCPVIEFGIVGSTMHQVDEQVAIADIEALARIYEVFLRRFFELA
jgi:succinyl-diaminopimelate desuccinylase